MRPGGTLLCYGRQRLSAAMETERARARRLGGRAPDAAQPRLGAARPTGARPYMKMASPAASAAPKNSANM